ncbi:hypothetical protein, partial [Thiolapillus sp.]|uniref:hypothetical protein n=1 Tax=Thiolapillus sp. TaxID=2017437 RepID=UPI003AF876B9
FYTDETRNTYLPVVLSERFANRLGPALHRTDHDVGVQHVLSIRGFPLLIIGLDHCDIKTSVTPSSSNQLSQPSTSGTIRRARPNGIIFTRFSESGNATGLEKRTACDVLL